MTATQDTPTNGHRGLLLLPATRVVGPTEQLQPPPPRSAEPEIAPDTAAPVIPQPVEPVSEPHPEPPTAPGPVHRAPDAPAVPRSIEQQMRLDGFTKPKGPDDPGSEVSFPLRKATKVGFAMTVAAAAVGQVMFFASFFGGGLFAYVGAGLIAAFAEVTMIGAGDSALRHKVEGNRGWQMLLGVSGSIAAGATVMQVAHWWATNPVMALTFGVASIAGWAVHIASGLIEANGYLRRKQRWDQELERRYRKREAREDAEYERRRANDEKDREAARRVRPPAEPEVTVSAPAPVAATPKANKPRPATPQPKRTAGPKRLDRDTAIRWWSENGQPGTKVLIRHFEAQGYAPVNPSTVWRWINGSKKSDSVG